MPASAKAPADPNTTGSPPRTASAAGIASKTPAPSPATAPRTAPVAIAPTLTRGIAGRIVRRAPTGGQWPDGRTNKVIARTARRLLVPARGDRITSRLAVGLREPLAERMLGATQSPIRLRGAEKLALCASARRSRAGAYKPGPERDESFDRPY